MDEIEMYFIKHGYKCNIVSGQKTIFEGKQDSVEQSMVWQYEVYKYASRLITKYKLRNVLDVGCGCGMKLKKLILPVCQNIIGIDEPDTISWCKQQHDFGTWYADNLEDPKIDLGRTFDLIISADAIEHLVNPDRLLEMIQGFSSEETFIILSTPERDETRGKDDIGPPLNPLHVREWNFAEFRKYIEHKGFRVIRHFRAEPLTPLQFQDANTLWCMRKILKWLLSIMSGRRRFLPEGQVLLLKHEPTKRKEVENKASQFVSVDEKKGAASNPLVSIITPVLNGSKYLEACIQSVLNQSYPYIEHVFVDGGSIDGTLDILSSYKVKYPDRIRFISESDKSAGEAWNKGLRMAKGEIFGWLGSDDMYEPNAILTIVEFFRTNPDAYFVFGDCNTINEKGEVIGKFVTKNFDLEETINDRHYIPCPSAFYKREVIEKIGLLDTRETGVELDYWIRVGKIFQVHRIEKVLSNFRIHKDSVSGAKDAGKMYIREGFRISRRHRGSIFSPRVRRYYRMVIIEGLRPILGPIYPFMRKALRRRRLDNKGERLR